MLDPVESLQRGFGYAAKEVATTQLTRHAVVHDGHAVRRAGLSLGIGRVWIGSLILGWKCGGRHGVHPFDHYLKATRVQVRSQFDGRASIRAPFSNLHKK